MMARWRCPQVLKALKPTGVPVPDVHILCEDASVIGTPFYVMEFVQGRIFLDPTMSEELAPHRDACIADMVRVLATLHSIKPETVGLGQFGKHGGYFERQLATLSRAAELQAQHTAPLPGKIVSI